MRRLTVQSGLLALAIAICAVGQWGCASYCLPRIDPSGERLFVSSAPNPRASFREMPAPSSVGRRVEVILCPRATVAPVGSEVILLAGVRGPDEYLRTNERLEWMIDPGSVGQFVDLDKGSWTDPFVGDFTRAEKIDNYYAVNTTSRRLLRLTRGTPDATDDVEVLKGQAWVTLTSAQEGTSDVTVYCPGVTPWDVRTEACQVHWVDAQWTFPSIGTAQTGGRQMLTTTVNRQTDNAPRCGWLVRYEIADGPPAGFAPDGSQAVEIPTDAQGKAVVELFQRQPQAGTNKISIQVIRPAGLGCPDQQIVVGRTCLAQTWSAPDLGVRVTGPSVGSIGANLGFRVEVRNPGDMAAEGVILTMPLPSGLSYVTASPASEVAGGTLRWNLVRLAAGEVRSIALDLRAERAGQYELCPEAVAASGLSSRSCTQVAIEAADLTLEVLGPMEAAIGDTVTHRIVVGNRSPVPATALVLTDVRDPGLEHAISKLQIEKSVGTLGAMQSQEVTITFRMLEAGQQCHTVQVTGAGGLQVSRRVCIEVRQQGVTQPAPSQPPPSESPWNQPGATPSPAPEAPPSTPPVAPTLPRFEVEAYFAVGGEPPIPIERASVGQSILLIVDVSSPEKKDLSGLTVAIDRDVNARSFKPEEASENHQTDNLRIFWENQGVAGDSLGRFAVKYLCQEAVTSARFRATVRDASGQQQTREVFITVSPAQPSVPAVPPTPGTETGQGLDVQIDTTYNPVRQGTAFTYRVLVNNKGAVEDRDIEVAVAFPSGLTPRAWGTMPSRFTITGNVVKFDSVPSLPAGDQLEYIIQVKAERIQQGYEVQASARSQNAPDGVSSQDVLNVTPAS